MKKTIDGYCDLHTHSTFSDGTYTPAMLIEAASAAGLSAVALTDHNNMGGLAEFTAAAAGSGVEAIPGIELSTDHPLGELHIVGLFVYPEHYDAIRGALTELSRLKTESNMALCEALTAAGYPVSYDAIVSKTPERSAATVRSRIFPSAISFRTARFSGVGGRVDAGSCAPTAPGSGEMNGPSR